MLTKLTKLLLVAVISTFSFQVKAQSNGFEVIKGLELMDMIYQHLDMYYVDEPKAGSLSKVAIDAMLKELDPYTVYYHESNMEDYLLMTTGHYGGIGSIIRKIDDYIVIAEPYEGSPSQKAGIKAGDQIISIDGRTMKGKNNDEVSSSLKGPKGSTIQVKVLRNNKEEITIPITRDEIQIPHIPYYGMKNETVGYISLNTFMQQTTAADVKAAILDLKSKGMKELVLDLRGNGGGLLIEAVKIVNFFVKKGTLVVNTKGRVEEENRVYKTMEEPLDLNIPLVVLIDESSASASEIVAGSLQDLDRAVIIGNQSFGKGLVQRTYDLKYGSKMKLTIAKYYTPSGRCVQRLEYYDKAEGQRPSEINDTLVKIFKTSRGRDVIDGRGILPDLEIKEKEYSRLTAMLSFNNVIFDFASDYYFRNQTIANPESFTLSDVEYAKFKEMAIKDTFDYSTASEEMLKRMRKTAEEEGYFDDAKVQYEELMQKVTPSKERDLEKFKDEIKPILENEIVSRYYYQKGRILHSFQNDDYLKKAIETLKDTKTYNAILKN
ncbi:MAG: S41 family peptidase [Crocinitomicaceae bacterium]|nr:S41 family peptidase [Crocinitomicaceae bacterium]